MKSFIIKLDKALAVELYNDIPIDFVGHILIEALFNIIQTSVPREISELDYHTDDPDSSFYNSVDLLNVVLEKSFPDDVASEETEEGMLQNAAVADAIAEKLTLAINAVNNANDFMSMSMVTDTLLSPEFTQSFKFGAKHLPGQVVFTLWTDSDPLTNPSLNAFQSLA